jgi:hypothetical protein
MFLVIVRIINQQISNGCNCYLGKPFLHELIVIAQRIVVFSLGREINDEALVLHKLYVLRHLTDESSDEPQAISQEL